MKCKKCGEIVDCEEHGDKYIVCEEDMIGNPYYYCRKCVEEYETALGAVTHIHFADFVKEVSEAMGLKVEVKVETRRGRQTTLTELMEERHDG